MGVNQDKKGRGKNPPRRHLQKNPSTVRPPPRPTDDLAGFEPGTSVTGIPAEAFRKKADQVGYALLVYLLLLSTSYLYSDAHV